MTVCMECLEPIAKADVELKCNLCGQVCMCCMCMCMRMCVCIVCFRACACVHVSTC